MWGWSYWNGNKKKVTTTKRHVSHINEVWDSGITITPPKIIIPLKLLNVCKKIQRTIGQVEFSILAKAKFTQSGIELSEEYYIPLQEVTSAEVEYREHLESLKQQGYNVVIHSHPWGGKSFSITDEETINSNFLVSILFDGSEFVTNTVCIQINENTKFKLKDIEMMLKVDSNIDVQGIDRIKKKITSYKVSIEDIEDIEDVKGIE